MIEFDYTPSWKNPRHDWMFSAYVFTLVAIVIVGFLWH